MEVRAVGPGWAQPQPFEARLYPFRGKRVLRSVRQPTPHGVGREEEQVGAKLGLSDRLDLRGAVVLRGKQPDSCEDESSGERYPTHGVPRTAAYTPGSSTMGSAASRIYRRNDCCNHPIA